MSAALGTFWMMRFQCHPSTRSPVKLPLYAFLEFFVRPLAADRPSMENSRYTTLSNRENGGDPESQGGCCSCLPFRLLKTTAGFFFIANFGLFAANTIIFILAATRDRDYELLEIADTITAFSVLVSILGNFVAYREEIHDRKGTRKEILDALESIRQDLPSAGREPAGGPFP